MSVPHPSQLDWNEIENKLSKDKKMATYMDGMDGGKHNSDDIGMTTTPTHIDSEEWREGYTKIEHPEWGTAFVRQINMSEAMDLLREWKSQQFDPYDIDVHDMLDYLLDIMETGIKGWVDWTNEELAKELNTLNTDSDWHYESEEDENGEECPVFFEVIGE